VFLGAFIIALPWMLQRMSAYTAGILGNLSRYGR
jgi:flagellar biosynthesis protein FliQ